MNIWNIYERRVPRPLEIIQQLKGIRCPSCLRQSSVPVMSCPDAIAKAIEKVLSVSQHGEAVTLARTPSPRPSKRSLA